MNWEALGSIAELVGAVGVVASLLYLGKQIRQNTRSIRAATYQALAESSAASNFQFIANADLVRAVRAGFAASEPLSEDDFARYQAYLRILFRRHDSIFINYREGALSEEAWLGYWHALRENLRNPGAQKWWQRHSEGYTRSFREAVDREIKSINASSGAAQQGAAAGESQRD
jgi:hypothetical protein